MTWTQVFLGRRWDVEEHVEMLEWCRLNCTGDFRGGAIGINVDKYALPEDAWEFSVERDATMFSLRWT